MTLKIKMILGLINYIQRFNTVRVVSFTSNNTTRAFRSGQWFPSTLTRTIFGDIHDLLQIKSFTTSQVRQFESRVPLKFGSFCNTYTILNFKHSKNWHKTEIGEPNQAYWTANWVWYTDRKCLKKIKRLRKVCQKYCISAGPMLKLF